MSRSTTVVLFVALLMVTWTVNAAPISLCNTGLGPVGQVDSCWEVKTPGSNHFTDAYRATKGQHPNNGIPGQPLGFSTWAPGDSESDWITSVNPLAPAIVGPFTYKYWFNTPTPALSVTVIGKVMTDGYVREAGLNNNTISVVSDPISYQVFSPFKVTVEGDENGYILVFVIDNIGFTEGARIALTGSYIPRIPDPTETPEPGTFLAGGIGLVTIGVYRHRRSRQRKT